MDSCADFRRTRPDPALAPKALILDDLAAALWVQAYDAAWRGRDWHSLGSHLDPQVEFVMPVLEERLFGRAVRRS